MTDRRDQYRIIRLGGHPIIAIPDAPRRLRLAAARRYQGATWKRAAFQRAVRSAITIGVDGLLGPIVDNPLHASSEFDDSGFDFAGWLNDQRRSLGDPLAVAAVVWPPQSDRGRVYVHLLAADSTPVAFAKIAFDATSDRFLAVEADTLRELQTMSLRECRPPALLAEGSHGGHRYVVMEPLPEQALPVPLVHDSYPTECVAEYASATLRLTAEQINQLDWWQTFQASRDNRDAFGNELNDAVKNGLDVCRVHGDLGPGNLIVDVKGQRLWLFDWEQSHPQGPIRTDPVSFFIAVEQPTILTDPSLGLRRLASHFLSEGSSFARHDVMAALAYLHTVRIPTATLLIDRWDEMPN